MMRADRAARLLLATTIGAGAAVVVEACVRAAGDRVPALAFFAAAAIATELIQVVRDDTSFDPADRHDFSFSSPVHFATAVLLGPWAAALVAAGGVVVVDGVHGQRLRKVLFNGSVFALGGFSSGYVFTWAGGTTGALSLPHDFVPLVALVLVYVFVNSVLVNAIVALSNGLFRWNDLFQIELSSRLPEASLGAAIVIVVLRDPWGVIALLPLVFAVYQGHARLALLRRETTRALETFANVVDERDPYTYRHSDRVAQYVRETAEELGLPSTVVQRLRWAGRLHDLGKIAVDASVLHKPDALTPIERAAMRRHPRLSARLLRRFRFAAEEARSVEYHHERFDGDGYYGVRGDELPLAAHLLAVADSYDAMTSDRPYRRGLDPAVALEELERNAGTQFHPAVVRVFVAIRRGEDARAALSEDERAELRALGTYASRERRLHALDLRDRPEMLVFLGAVAGLVALGAGVVPAAAVGLVVAIVGAALTQVDRFGARRLARSVQSIAQERNTRQSAFSGIVGALTALYGLRWAALVEWRERELSGSIALAHGGPAPADTSLTSWFIRDADAGEDLLVGTDGELGVPGVHVALPLRDETGLRGFLVLGFPSALPRRLTNALLHSAPALAEALAPPLRVVPVVGEATA